MLLHTSDLAYPGENPRPLNILQESRMMEKIAKMMELSKKQSSIFILLRGFLPTALLVSLVT